MTDPATARDFRACSICGSHTRSDIAGSPPRCWSCGKVLAEPVAATPATVCPLLISSPIVARHKYLSPSARRAEMAAGANPS